MKNSDSGHTINVTNFHTLIINVYSFGPRYAPQRSDLTLAGLNSLYSTASAGMSTVNSRFSAWKIAVSDRDITFRPLSELATRVLGALRSSAVRIDDIESIIPIIRKLRGQRATPKHTVTGPEPNVVVAANPGNPPKAIPKNISASQMSFDSRVANMDILIKLLLPLAGYNPNEPELSVSGLKTLYNVMVSQNDSVVTITVSLSRERGKRDQILYAPLTGMFDIAQAVKNYVKSVFKAKSKEFMEVSAISFKKLGKI
jgi:hypothetical protein